MDAGDEPIFDSHPSKERASTDQNDDQGMGEEHTAGPNLIVWLDKPLSLKHAPATTTAKLYGVYRRHTNIATISLIIEHDGTEYRAVRYHKPVSTLLPIDAERLGYIHNNMVHHFMRRYGDTTWSLLLKKFLKWNTNRLYADALCRL